MAQKPFYQPRLKIARAAELINELEGVFNEFTSSNPLTIREEVVGKYVHHEMHLHRPPPPMLSPIIGDVIHNLRTSLDILVCELVRLNDKSDKDVYFPFAENETQLEVQIKRKKIHRASPQALAVLRDLKPYRGGNVALREVHDLDVQDKHTGIIPSIGYLKSPGIGIGLSLPDAKVGIVSKGKSLIRSGVAGRNGTFPLPVKLTFHPNSKFSDQEVPEALHRLTKYFAGIIDSFEMSCL